MRWFDRWAKLRDVMRMGRLHTEQKEILGFIQGTVSMGDLPTAIAEVADEFELTEVLRTAKEKGLNISVATGRKRMAVKGLAQSVLVLTSRLASSPVFSAERQTVHVGAGMSPEALAIDLARAGVRWAPLFPIPSETSVGAMIAEGWEGLRVWSGGGTVAHICSVDWMGYDGTKYSTGPAASGAQAPDLLPFLFGAGAAHGVITSAELRLARIPGEPTVALFELESSAAAVDLLEEIRVLYPQPDIVVYWGETATDLIRGGNDGTIGDRARVVVAAEWSQPIEWPHAWSTLAIPQLGSAASQALWQDLFRLPRTAARLHPYRSEVRLRAEEESLPELEELARAIGREANLKLCLWGTVGCGYLTMWALAPDQEQRTQRAADEAVCRFVLEAERLGVRAADELPGSIPRAAERTRAQELVRDVGQLMQRKVTAEA